MKDYNILYVDDEQANLNSLKSLFRRKFDFITANSGQKGMEILETQPVQLIIADQRMPEMTGIEFLKKVKEKWPDIKSILLTAFHDNQVIKEAVNDVGIFWYMNKPFDNEKLELVIRKAFEAIRSEELIKKSEEKFRGVFESITDVFVRRTFEGEILMVSPSIFDVTGYTDEEIMEQNVPDYFVDPELPNKRNKILIKEGGVQTFESEIIKKDGSVITISSSAKLYFDNAGNPIGIESVFRDVSEKKRAEQALKESKERYQSLSDASFEAIFISEKGVCVEQNALAEQMFGYSLTEAIGRHGTDWVIPEDSELVKNNMLSGFEKPYKVTALRKDGSTFPAEIQGRTMYLKGKNVGVTALIDISRRKLAEEALIESEKKFRSLVTNTEEIIYIIAKDGTFMLSEGKGLAKMGLQSGDVVGKSVFDLYKDYPDMLDQIREAFKGKTVMKETKVGDNYFKNWYTPQINTKGEIIGLLGLSINITEQKEAEEQVQEYQSRLQALASELILTEEKMRKQLAIDLHDDVGQLLSSSRMQLAVIDFEGDRKLIKKKIKDISQTLLVTIKATREVIFNLSPPQLNEIGLYAAIHDWMKEEIEKKYNIRTSIKGDKSIYDLDENTIFLLFRSIRELLINVIKHAQANFIKVILINNYKSLVIVVKDDGIGFDYDPEKINLSNRGFGLFSIKERISNLGGSMTIVSKRNFGTEVKLILPNGK